MQLSQSEFQDRLDEDMMRIAFIGMSNTGKSFRSHQMEQVLNFSAWHVDEEIEKDLALADMSAMASWMGYPFEEKYAARSKKYLDLERKNTLAPDLGKTGNFIMDTTGSVIYHDQEVRSFLQHNFLVILLDIPNERITEMQELFFKEPKSVFWGNSFQPYENEENIDALKRCYPQLLKDRMEMYRDLADIVIPAEISKMEGLSIERFMEIISFALPR